MDAGVASPAGRPLAILSFAFNHALTGMDPFWFKLTGRLAACVQRHPGVGAVPTPVRALARRSLGRGSRRAGCVPDRRRVAGAPAAESRRALRGAANGTGRGHRHPACLAGVPARTALPDRRSPRLALVARRGRSHRTGSGLQGIRRACARLCLPHRIVAAALSPVRRWVVARLGGGLRRRLRCGDCDLCPDRPADGGARHPLRDPRLHAGRAPADAAAGAGDVPQADRAAAAGEPDLLLRQLPGVARAVLPSRIPPGQGRCCWRSWASQSRHGGAGRW